MRTVDAALTAALAAGHGKPFFKAYVGYSNGTVKNSHTNLIAYKLTGTTLDLWIPSVGNIASDQEQIWLERGLTIAGTDYTLTTGRFWIWDEEYLPERVTHYRGGIVPNEYYSAAGDVSYETAIDAFFTAFGKTTTYKDDTEAWLDYQFLPDGQSVLMNRAIRFLNQLQQKRLIGVCDNGAEDVRIYSADVLGSSVLTLTAQDEWSLFTTKEHTRQYIWKDENQTLHTDGAATDPLHNLGYLESTDEPTRSQQRHLRIHRLLSPGPPAPGRGHDQSRLVRGERDGYVLRPRHRRVRPQERHPSQVEIEGPGQPRIPHHRGRGAALDDRARRQLHAAQYVQLRRHSRRQR